VRVLEKRFADAISAGRVSGVECIERCCVLAAVGQGMVARKGAAATMFGALAKANVNIKAIAQVGPGLGLGVGGGGGVGGGRKDKSRRPLWCGPRHWAA
jgi:hypothetical protein